VCFRNGRDRVLTTGRVGEGLAVPKQALEQEQEQEEEQEEEQEQCTQTSQD
jgi:hypothetical protein